MIPIRRAVAALVALALGPASAAPSAGCKAIDGIYRNEALDAGKTWRTHLDNLVRLPMGDNRLFARERAANGKLSSRHLAATVAVSGRPEGLRFEYRDAAGKVLLVQYPDWPFKWRCAGDTWEWSNQSYSGVGDKSALTRSRGVLAKLGSGELLWVEERTDPLKQPPDSRIEWRFPQAQAPAK